VVVLAVSYLDVLFGLRDNFLGQGVRIFRDQVKRITE
jgi:hypothetical protein